MRYKDLSEAITGFPLSKVVVFDTETTGVNQTRDEILSISICDGHGNELFNSLVRPTKHKQWPDASKVNGIYPRDVRNAPTLKEITPAIQQHLLGNKLLVGYNTQFDLSFLVQAGVFEEWPGATFDVMREYATVRGTKRSQYGGYRWSKLADCAASYGYRFGVHDAREDAKATAFCYRALLSDEKYLTRKIDELMERIIHVSVNQTKATSANVMELVESGVTTSIGAELRLGSLTRGKNAGKPRYECFVNDKCVGVQGFGQLENIRLLYSLSDDDPLPKSIPCKALLSMVGTKARCSVEITARGKLRDDLRQAARQEHEALGLQGNASQVKPEIIAYDEEPKASTEELRNSRNGHRRSYVAVLLVLLGAAGVLSGMFVGVVLVVVGVLIWRMSSRN